MKRSLLMYTATSQVPTAAITYCANGFAESLSKKLLTRTPENPTVTIFVDPNNGWTHVVMMTIIEVREPRPRKKHD